MQVNLSKSNVAKGSWSCQTCICYLKKEDSITSKKLGSRDFWWIANIVLNNGPKVLSSAFDKAKLFAENFFKNSNLDNSDISLPVFPSRTNLKLLNISVNSQDG